MTAASRSAERQSWLRAGIGLAVICVLSYLLTRLSLDSVPGVTRRANGDCCNTEFVNNGWWLAMVGLGVPVWWVTRTLPWLAIPAVVIPTYATFHVASTVIDRYLDSGWGDGLEVLSYVVSLGHALVFLVAAAIGIFSWRRRRRALS